MAKKRKPSQKDLSLKAKRTGYRFKTDHLKLKNGELSSLGKQLRFRKPTKAEIEKYKANADGSYPNKTFQVYMEQRADRKHSDDNLKLKYEQGGSIAELEAELAKQEKASTNTFLPESIRDKAKHKIAEIKAKLDAAKKPEVSAKVDADIDSQIEKLKAKLRDPKFEPFKKSIEKQIAKLEEGKGAHEKQTKEGGKKPKEKKERKPNAQKGKVNPTFAKAKEIQKEGESRKDAVKRAAKELKGEVKPKKKELRPSKKAKAKSVKKPMRPSKKAGKKKKEIKLFTRKKGKLRELKNYRNRAEADEYNVNIDAQRKAMKVGKRISREGNVYYEYRKNRADKNPDAKRRKL